ncbi:uncharacterized protein LOC115232682 isoform X1 [Octopus sinensis]|uniref:Uncharacterized protein LOC115232682 isoform X1 n=1 Tax=Octopus sinensis TaxID=2607531 RepID=A0A7E6FT69_9MOLL|nr:uncharacterized protein LOC115232682 isoform X1 [Octopus sinensis]
MNIDVVIQDADDNPPIFTEKTFSKAIIFDISKEEKILEFKYYVNDADTDPKNKQHKYFIESFEYFGNDALKQLKTPFEIRNSGIYRKADLDSSVSGYIQMLIKANDTNGLDTTATVKIHILSESDEVKIVFAKPIEKVRSQNHEFIQFLQSVVGDEYEIVPGKLDVSKNDKGELDPLRTSLVLFAVKNATKKVVPPKELLKILDKNRVLNAERFENFAVERVKESEPFVTVDSKEKDFIIFITVIVVLVFILTVTMILFYASNRRLYRKLRAAKTTVYASDEIAEDVYPGTNLFSEGQINPLYNNLDEKDMGGPLPEKGSLNSDINNDFDGMYHKNINAAPKTLYNFDDDTTYSIQADNSKSDLDSVIKERDAEMNKINNDSTVLYGNSDHESDVEATEV